MKLRYGIDGNGRRHVHFRCPGCNDEHVLPIEGADRPCWQFNGDLEKPTLSPSILSKSGHYVEGHEGSCWCSPDPDGEAWGFKCHVCHSFVRGGRIEFLSDCTHALAGQTVDLPELA